MADLCFASDTVQIMNKVNDDTTSIPFLQPSSQIILQFSKNAVMWPRYQTTNALITQRRSHPTADYTPSRPLTLVRVVGRALAVFNSYLGRARSVKHQWAAWPSGEDILYFAFLNAPTGDPKCPPTIESVLVRLTAILLRE